MSKIEPDNSNLRSGIIS